MQHMAIAAAATALFIGAGAGAVTTVGPQTDPNTIGDVSNEFHNAIHSEPPPSPPAITKLRNCVTFSARLHLMVSVSTPAS